MHKFLGKYLSIFVTIILAMLTLATSWGMAKGEVAGLHRSMTAVEARTSHSEEKLNNLEVSNARQGQLLQDIKDTLTEMREDVKDIKRGVHR